MADLAVVCTSSAAALTARRDGLLNGLIQRAFERHGLPNGCRFRFAGEADILDHIFRAVIAERHCCRFLGFTIALEPDEGPITLDVTGPAGTPEFLSALFDLS
jgi:hypothetical protein